MIQRKDDVFMELENEFRKDVQVFDLPCGPLVRTFDDGDTQRKRETHEWTEEDKRRFKKAYRIAKNKNERLLKDTEDMTDEDIMDRFTGQCRGLHTHFAYFSTIADTAIRNNWTIGYGTYRKRVKRGDIEKEHRSLKTWIKKNGKDTMTAVSIGLGKNGYVYVFFVSTSADGVAVGDIGTAFYQNRRKKGYTPVECRPFEKNPYSFLKSHYCSPLQYGMELTTLKSRECACMIRSSFALHGKHKTLRTQEAIANLYNYMYLAPIGEALGGDDIAFEQPYSLLTDWAEDEYWLEEEEDT